MTDSDPEQLPSASYDETLITPESSSSTLKYPQILLETSFDSLLTHSYPSNPASSTTMEVPQRGTASLSESWASISDAELSLDDASDLHSEHTDFGSLIDIHSTGDIHSVRDDETSSEADRDDQDAQPDEEQDSVVLNTVQTPMNASEMEPNVLGDGRLTLDEPNTDEADVASKALKHFSQDELRKWRLPIGEDFVGKIHMPIGKDFIKDAGRQTFRILLFRPETASNLDNMILHKLADAQLASDSEHHTASPPSPSKYHVVPDTFGPGSQPAAAAVLPVDHQLEAVHYETARFESPTSKTILLGDRDDSRRTTSTWTQDATNPYGAYVMSGSQMEEADLAVVVIDDLRQAKNREFGRASLAFARRHRIPTLAFRLQDGWIAEPGFGAYIADGLNLTVQDASGSEDTIVRMLPIDADMFLNLDSSQLSRHIRRIMQQESEMKKLRQASTKPVKKEPVDVEKNAQDQCKTQLSWKDRVGLKTDIERCMHVLIFMLCGIIVLHGLTAVKTMYEVGQANPENVSELEAIVGSTETPQPSSQSSTKVSMLSKDVAVATAIPPPPPTGLVGPRKTFEVEVVGNSHLVVRTAREHRNPDQLQVSITRHGRPLPADVRVLFPSVWSVRLEPEQAYGDLCVQLFMKRPALNETVAVNLGQQPLDAWFKTLRDDTEQKIVQQMALLQESIEKLQRQERPQNLVKNVQARTRQMLQHVHKTLESSDWHDRAFSLQQTLLDRTEAFTQKVNQRASRLGAQLREIPDLRVTTSKVAPDWLECGIDRVRRDYHNLLVRYRVGVHKLWEKVQDGPQSEQLATAQQRAQRVVSRLRERLTQR